MKLLHIAFYLFNIVAFRVDGDEDRLQLLLQLSICGPVQATPYQQGACAACNLTACIKCRGQQKRGSRKMAVQQQAKHHSGTQAAHPDRPQLQ